MLSQILLEEKQSEIENHHELCLGVMALCYPQVTPELQKAIEEGIQYASDLGFPVSVENLKSGKALFSGGNS